MPLMYSVEKCVPVIRSARLCAMYDALDLRLADRHVRAVLAQEDQRKRVLVLDAQHDGGRESRRVDADVTDVAAFARDRLDEEAPHRVVADTRDQTRLQAEARAAERRVRRRSAEILCEGRHVLEACADLLRVEIDAEAAETQDVVRTAFREARSVLHKSQYMQFPEPRPAWICFRGAVCRRSRC